MQVSIELENGMLPDAFGKYAPEEYRIGEYPVRSFPIALSDVPAEAKSLALAFVDWDAIPVGGFCWIHWIACDVDPQVRIIPENASASGELAFTQGSNSEWSPLAGSNTDSRIVHRYIGPIPPDKTHVYTLTVYALDCELGLSEGFYLNEMRRAMEGHVLAEASVDVPSRS